MAANSILRRTASYWGRPLASRLIKTQRNYDATIFTAVKHAQASRSAPLNPPFCRNFSSEALKKPTSDENLIRVIESEIKYAHDTDDHDSVEEVPSGFPFEIEDIPGQQIITLKRTYQGEEMTVEVHMTDLVTGEQNDVGDGDYDSERAPQSSVPLVVNVSKKDGVSLNFSCTACPDEIFIDSLIVKNAATAGDEIAYEGPDFHDLDENLQKAFHKYLEIRGIKPSTTNFLHEYMINKNSRENLLWLKKVKKFIEA